MNTFNNSLNNVKQPTAIKAESFHPFHMRTRNLDKFKNEIPAYRFNHHKNVMDRAKINCLTSTTKSLDILRACLQSSFNQEVDNLLQKYLQQYFKPAIDNVRANKGDQSVSEYHIHTVFRQLLEEAKKMYFSPESMKITTPTLNSFSLSKRKRLNSTNRRENENNFNVVNNRAKQTLTFSKRLSTSEMEKKKKKQNQSKEICKVMLTKRKLGSGQVSRGRPPLSNKKLDLGVDNLNPNRITEETRFVLGSKANRALGFGTARGRLYTKHTDLFKYIGDSEDKQYLHDRGLFPISGARAFLIVKDDIEKILTLEEYKDAPGKSEMGKDFILPEFILKKIKNQMTKQRVEREKLNESTNTFDELDSLAN